VEASKSQKNGKMLGLLFDESLKRF